MSNLDEVKALIEEQGKSWNEFKTAQSTRLGILEKETTELMKRAGRPGAEWQGTLADASGTHLEKFIDTKTGKAIPVLKHGDSLAALHGKSSDTPSPWRLLRGLVLGGNAPDAAELAEERKSMNIGNDPSGGFTVTGTLAAEWIDNLRALSALSRAGITTLPMDSAQVSLARVTADPAVSWHGESAALPEAAPTFGKLTLTPKTAVCMARFSLEISQDSVDFERQLQGVLVGAMAAAIDSAGLNGVTTNAAAAPSGILNLSGRNSVTSVGAPANWDFLADAMYELLADNVPEEEVGSFIANPALWKVMAKKKTGITNDNTPLQASPEIARIPRIWTTAMPAASGVIARWADVVMGIRQQITVKVLDQSFMGSNLDLALLCYSRLDFGVTRPTSVCSVEGITT
jgi:HK97 family phage major capsid protein